MPGRTITTEQAVAAIQLAEAVGVLEGLARTLGLTPCEVVGNVMFEFRPIDTRSAPMLTSHAQVGGA
ncbi:hypothetical protein GPX89_34585 [Nocardia sp. ET3-3]|uniref:Uncharacterized protein n=1 Tax=Nocardia terrae TaxID=2675851 RepID=A0A7K1V8D8_9NOCA|nr:hypothetical protein [Nocardia terrae]MVU82348.1 hypothetical protein [Nocardia terrae]